ncbi:hypothetical protein ACFO3D_18305 [Virgibacillus kekensis]|uniref:Uncharacterized protein n=1 Tax=Virgibacillus kekensis TaxID=202261 RepID=A0ABV9DMJ3_9BACI
MVISLNELNRLHLQKLNDLIALCDLLNNHCGGKNKVDDIND